MKINRVKSERDVKGGKFYIRACVNYTGQHWVEVFRIVGKAFNTESPYMKGYRQLKTIQPCTLGRRIVVDDQYVNDLGIGGRKGACLFEYSSKVHKYLLSLSKQQFNDVVNNTQLTDIEWLIQLNDWKFQREMDEMSTWLDTDDQT